jgi:hypothetical protein
MFCSNCGNKLKGSDKFCSGCGNDVTAITGNSENSIGSVENHVFTEEEPSLTFYSRLLLGGNIIRPDRLIIENKNVIYEKRNKHLIGVDRVMIPISRIASVEIDRGIIRSKIIIYNKGDQTITVENFKVGDGRRIKRAIEERM